MIPWWQRPPAFARYNLRRNPFGELTSEERGALAVIDLPPITEAAPLQIVADAGHGKTTHLLGLRARERHSTYEYVPEGQRSVKTALPVRGLFLLDEAQRLTARELRRVLAMQPLLALGTHEDLSARSPRPLVTLRLEALSLAKLRSVVEAKIAAAADGPPPIVTDDRLEALRSEHGANLRAIEHTLYDWVQHGEL